jgi:hypothetical protein
MTTENMSILSPTLVNGSLLIPHGRFIAVDPLVYMQLLNQNFGRSYYTELSNNMILQPQMVSLNVNDTNVTDANLNVKKEVSGTKKRKSNGLSKSQRRVRPKVVPEKGAIQCKGMNRKRNQRCRNAALMEYIGPRPKYCAEHIQLDPECLHMKCSSHYQKMPGDKKGCREVVLKEFGLCHKHFKDATDKMTGKSGFEAALKKIGES